jgi:hypothetical protein
MTCHLHVAFGDPIGVWTKIGRAASAEDATANVATAAIAAAALARNWGECI